MDVEPLSVKEFAMRVAGPPPPGAGRVQIQFRTGGPNLGRYFKWSPEHSIVYLTPELDINQRNVIEEYSSKSSSLDLTFKEERKLQSDLKRLERSLSRIGPYNTQRRASRSSTVSRRPSNRRSTASLLSTRQNSSFTSVEESSSPPPYTPRLSSDLTPNAGTLSMFSNRYRDSRMLRRDGEVGDRATKGILIYYFYENGKIPIDFSLPWDGESTFTFAPHVDTLHALELKESTAVRFYQPIRGTWMTMEIGSYRREEMRGDVPMIIARRGLTDLTAFNSYAAEVDDAALRWISPGIIPNAEGLGGAGEGEDMSDDDVVEISRSIIS